MRRIDDATLAVSEQRALWLATHVLPNEPALRRWLCKRMAVCGVDADDVVQEVYAVLAGLQDVAEIRDPWAYLIACARSTVLNTLRRARIVRIEAFASLDHLDAEEPSAGPERHVNAHQQLRETLALIQSLPEKCRRAFVLRRVHGLSQREIAQRMGISENTVEKHICKGIRLLAQAMGHGTNSDGSISGGSISERGADGGSAQTRSMGYDTRR